MTQTALNSESSLAKRGPSVRITKEDITLLSVDCIVYYATPDLKLGTGFGSLISRRGGSAVQNELKAVLPRAVGEAVVTSAGKLKARAIIHAVGPAFQEAQLRDKLKRTMESALKCAEEQGAATVAFPPMGTGFFGVPAGLSAEVMGEAISEFSKKKSCIREIVICVNDEWLLAPFRTLQAAG